MIVDDRDLGKRFEFGLRNGTLLRGTVATIRATAKSPNFLVEDTTGQLHMLVFAEVSSAKPLDPGPVRRA